jgi:hypothetical protein
MQLICTHKIGSHSSKPSHAYPVIGLPREFKAIAGRNARVYQTKNNGNLAFLITIDEEVGNLVATWLESADEDRVKDLELRIEDLEDTIFNNTDPHAAKIEKDKKIKGRGRDSNPRRGLHRSVFWI